MAEYNHGTHRTQFDGSELASENCVPTSLANGARELTHGEYDVSGAKIRSLVARSEEQNPNTPGWSLRDASLAASRANIAFSVVSGTFAAVRNAVDQGYAVLLQGDSDQFNDTTCSGRFNGDHCVCLHPEDLPATKMLLADPICRTRREESAATIQRYAEKFAGSQTLAFGIVGGMGMAVQYSLNRWQVRTPTALRPVLFYETPNGKRIGSFSKGVVVTSLGPSLTTLDADGVDYSWQLVLVSSSAVSGVLSEKWVWVKRADLTLISSSSEWDASVLRLLADPAGKFPAPPAPSDPAELEKARKAGFEQAKQKAVQHSSVAANLIKDMTP